MNLKDLSKYDLQVLVEALDDHGSKLRDRVGASPVLQHRMERIRVLRTYVDDALYSKAHPQKLNPSLDQPVIVEALDARLSYD